jgi:hypothetical protein
MTLLEQYAHLSESGKSDLSYRLWNEIQTQTYTEDNGYINELLTFIIQHPFYPTHDEFQSNMMQIQHMLNQYEKNDVIKNQLWIIFESFMVQEHDNYLMDLANREDARVQRPSSYSQIDAYKKLIDWAILGDFREQWIAQIIAPYAHYIDPVLAQAQSLLENIQNTHSDDSLNQFEQFLHDNQTYFIKSPRNNQACQNSELQTQLTQFFKKIDGPDNEIISFFYSLQKRTFNEQYLDFFTYNFELYEKKSWSVPFFTCSSKLPENVANSYYQQFSDKHFNYLCSMSEHKSYTPFIKHFFNEELIHIPVVEGDSEKLLSAFTHIQKLLSNLDSFDYSQLLIHTKNHPAQFEQVQSKDVMAHYLKYLDNKSRASSTKNDHLNFKSLGAWNLATRLHKNINEKIPYHQDNDTDKSFKI